MSSSQHAGNSSPAGSGVDGDSDEEMDWEEVSAVPVRTVAPAASVPDYNIAVDEEVGPSTSNVATAGAGHIEITLKKVQRVDPEQKKRAEQNAELRALRLTCHKIHTVALLANAIVRNELLNVPLLKARLLSLTPISHQTSFNMITRKRHPEPAKRGRLFESTMMRLTQWWYEEFFEIEGNDHIKSRTFDEVQKVLFDIDFEDSEGEVIRSAKSLMKHALNRRGSRDVSAQLFTALCRALDIPARLVVSLQSVPWQAGAGKAKSHRKKPSKKGKEKAVASSDSDLQESDDDMEEVSIPEFREEQEQGAFPGEGRKLSGVSTPNLKGKDKPKHVVKLRKSKSSGQRLGSKPGSRQRTPAPVIGGSPPVFWIEVFSRPDGRWMPIDPTRYIVNKRKVFEPPAHDRNNRMVYVVAVEEDGYCRDVTARYARDYGTKTSKSQLGGKGRKEWWESVMTLVTRPYRLVRDDVEDEEFEYLKYTEGMPTSVAGFKNHPIYVLEQHLKREEVLYPKVEVGTFRGEPVYRRSNVISLKTAENWMRMGRRVKEGAQALKWVKQRAVTIHRRRAMELAQQDGNEMLQGLYSEAQTEPYIPDPVINGIIPKNEFGNIDLYTPSMLPNGAVHIPHKGIAKISRKLGFDYAEAVTNFEFKKGRAFPVLSGIVVASENEETLLEAYWEAEREAELKEQAKKRERVIKRWSRLIHGLRIRQRLQQQYAGRDEPSSSGLRRDDIDLTAEIEEPGGFLTDADAIVQPFHLPRFEHGTYQPPSEVGTAAERDEVQDKITTNGGVNLQPGTQPSANPDPGDYLVEEEEDDDLEEILPVAKSQIITWTEGQAPKSMLDLAKETAARSMDTSATELNGIGTRKPFGTESTLQPLSGEQTTSHTIHSSAERGSIPPVTKSRPNKIGGVRKTDKRRHSLRKHAANRSSSSSSELSDLEEDVGKGEDSGEGADTSRQRTRSSRSASKRKRSKNESTAPPQSTRVLRTRVPKSTDQLKVERKAEAAYRRAIAGSFHPDQ